MAKSWRDTGMRARDKGPWWRPVVSTESLLALVCAWFVLVMNGPLWAAVRAGDPASLIVLPRTGHFELIDVRHPAWDVCRSQVLRMV